MTVDAKIQALENSLKSFGFNEKLFIYSVGNGKNVKFAVASKNENGGLKTHSNFYTYDEMNAYLFGYYNAININKISKDSNLL